MHNSLDLRPVRRLAVVAAGLAKPRWNGLPTRVQGRGSRARRAALQLIDHFGYLQLDTISIAGARSHALVLLSRLRGLDPRLAEDLLKPRQPLFEYWGHEASWMPLDLYPVFRFRRQMYRRHPWWGDLLTEHADIARDLRRRIEHEGPLRSVDLEGERAQGMWNLKLTRKVADAMWLAGDLAIRERRHFHILYDLTERVVPADLLERTVALADSLKTLLLYAAKAHGWATTGTLASTWRLRNMASSIKEALAELSEEGALLSCALETPERRIAGWIRPEQREQAERLRSVRLSEERAVLLSPFDPLLWDRARTQLLFDFHQVLEIFKPAHERIYGYYCLPILVGERLIGRCDLKAHRKEGRLEMRSLRFENTASGQDRHLAQQALDDYAGSLGMALADSPS